MMKGDGGATMCDLGMMISDPAELMGDPGVMIDEPGAIMGAPGYGAEALRPGVRFTTIRLSADPPVRPLSARPPAPRSA
jgi:hypothetical protein